MATRTIMEPTKTAKHTKINTNNVPPPPGMMSPIRNSVGVSQSPGRPSSEQQQIHSYLSSPLHTNGSTLFVSSPGNNGSVGGSSPGMLRRRAATEDNSQLFLHNNNTQQQQHLTQQHQRSTSTNELPWTNIQSNTNIFRSDKGLGSPGNPARRVSQEEQRNESTHRLRSDLLDPMLLSPTNNSIDDDDNDEHRLASSKQQQVGTPRQQQSNDIFRNNNRGYSPIIGTPTRASGGRKPMYNITSNSQGGAQVGGLRNNLSLSSNSDTDSVTSGGHWSSNNSQASGGGFATTIRPSLSCPTSVFESPLFPSSTSTNNIAGSNVHPLTRLRSRGSSLGASNHLRLGGGTSSTLLLSQPYRLEKITSGSVEPSPINNSDGNANQYEFEDEDDLLDNVKSQDVFDTESSPIKSPSENSATQHGHRLNLDVSVIEVEDDDSPHRRPTDGNKGPQDRLNQQQQSPNTGGSQHSMASQINNMTASQHANNTGTTKNNTSRPSTAGNESGTTQTTMLDVDGNPMRNLSDAFELLVVDGSQQQPLHSQHVYAQQQQRGGANNIHANQMNDTMLSSQNDVSKNNSGETSATKPSPTSVSDFGGETTSSSSLTTNSTNNNNVSTKKKTHQLANGLTVASISMPHFHLHDTLRGTLNQGLIDRASFYSVLRDINKEALDATLTDPKGHLYNDGSVHEKNKVGGGGKGGKKNKKQQQGQVGGQSSDANNDTTTDNNNVGGKKKKERPTPIVIAEDGKVHVHPDPKEEQKSILVMACVTDENIETVSEQQLASLREKPVSLGAALLDEEWWLMSAIASRTPNEVAMNQSTNLLPTFFEAMGEKDANSVADSTGVYSTGATSRTQLWKPGRSWWEAKSGKNPWVEPVVHNNRWR